MKSPQIPASFLKRLAALIIDLFILQFIVYIHFKNHLPTTIEAATASPQSLILPIAIMSACTLAYFIYLEAKLGQTIGQKLMNIAVKGKVSWDKHLINNLFLIPFFPFQLLWVIDPLYYLFKGQRLLEKYSGLTTVEVKP